jgi:hypothetical protein
VKRHPAQRDLAAWFDGEDAPGVGDHLRGCRRCRNRTAELGRIRAAVIGERVPPRQGWVDLVVRARAVALVPMAVALVLLLVASGRWDSIARPVTVATRYLTGQDTSPRVPAAGPASTAAFAPSRTGSSAAAGTLPTGPLPADERFGPAPPTTGATPSAATSAPESTPPAPASDLQQYASAALPAAPAPEQPATPLRLGAFVPSEGFDAGEGRQVARALHRAVDAANEAGGVAGRKIELLVVPAEDREAVASLGGRVDVIVGGFGATLPPAKAGQETPPWLFPAEPHPQGPSVVSAELDPTSLGTRLGEDLVDRGFTGVVGVIRGGGPDEALADGLAAVPGLTLTEVEAEDDTGCTRELMTLRQRRAVAVAVAGPPELAARCADARVRMAWNPRGGVLVPASAAYAHLEVLPTAAGARTVLGLPWPTGNHRGAARYRAAVPGPASYRALVSYAGVELAVQVARARGTVTHADVTGGHWTSDLIDFEATRRAATVVHVTLGRWDPDDRRSEPRPAQNDRRAR